MNIRLAKQQDLPQVLELIRLSILDMDDKGIKQWPNHYPNEADFVQDITKKQLFVSEDKLQIIGIVTLSPNCPPQYDDLIWKYKNGKVNSVHRLAVHPKLKTPKLAQKLMNYVEDIARDNGFALIRLDTYSKNTIANKFYKKLAYHFCGDINLPFMPEKYRCYEKKL